MQDNLEPAVPEAENHDGLASLAILVVTIVLIVVVVVALL